MDIQSVDEARLRAACERYGIARLDVFGSVSRGEDTADSDIDLLYELKPGTRTTWDFFALEDELADILGRAVDLVERKSINRFIREEILHDARPFYAA